MYKGRTGSNIPTGPNECEVVIYVSLIATVLRETI